MKLIDTKGAALDHEAGIGIVAEIEQDVAADEVTLLGADREHAQRGVSQQAQCRDTLEKRYVVID